VLRLAGSWDRAVRSLRERTAFFGQTELLEFAAIRALHDRPSLTQRQLASVLGVSVGRAHYCVRALISKGLVKAKTYSGSRNKAAYLYLFTPSGIAEKSAMTRRFLERKMREFDELASEIDQLRTETAKESNGQ
jgi:EPS-associated MarR family transcriptional regulator